jgi:hypothetical protein
MKKVLFTTLITASLVYLYVNKNSNHKDQEVSQDTSSVISEEVVQRVDDHREKILRKALPTKLTKHKSFKPFLAKQSNNPTTKKNSPSVKIDEAFLQGTFNTLMQCYKDGCGEEPDHDGYFNAGQTAAVLSLNQVLEDTLGTDKKESSAWISEQELLELFSTPNKHTRDLAFKHMMNRGPKDQQLSKVMEGSEKLSGYSYSETVNNVIDYIDDSNKDEFIDSVVKSFAKIDDNAKIETLFALEEKKLKMNEDHLNDLMGSVCHHLNDPNNGKAYATIPNEIAKNSGSSTTIQERCK